MINIHPLDYLVVRNSHKKSKGFFVFVYMKPKITLHNDKNMI